MWNCILKIDRGIDSAGTDMIIECSQYAPIAPGQAVDILVKEARVRLRVIRYRFAVGTNDETFIFTFEFAESNF